MNEEILLSIEGHLGLMTLNRPGSLNAINHSMVDAMSDALSEWARDPLIRHVAIRGAGERGLCCGGDVVAIYRALLGHRHHEVAAFWAAEYRLNAAISRYQKPYIALMDGFVLGGGVGVSAHGSHRIVTERSAIGMPETRIGFFPDVGASWLLSRAPGELGTSIALTGGMVGGSDAIALGLADYYVPSAKLDSLVNSLASTDAESAIALVTTPVPQSDLLDSAGWVDFAFAADSVAQIIDGLASVGDAAADARAQIERNSPTALELTLRSLRRAQRASTLDIVLEDEYRLAVRLVVRPTSERASGHALSIGTIAHGGHPHRAQTNWRRTSPEEK